MSKLLLCLSSTILVTLIAGCTSFLPENAYPIYRNPTAEEQTALQDQQKRLGTYTDLTTALTTVMNERLWYLKVAEDAQRGIYNQSDWTTAGGALGTIGGLAKSVPTAAVGAIVGGGSAVVASRYSLGGQSKAYLLAADKAGCTWAVLNGYSRDNAQAAALGAGDGAVLTEVSLGSLQIQSELRRTLMDFNPSQNAVDPKQIVALYKQHEAAAKKAGEQTEQLLLQRELLADKEYGVSVLRKSLGSQQTDTQRRPSAALGAEGEVLKKRDNATLAAEAATELARGSTLASDDNRKRRIVQEVLGANVDQNHERLQAREVERDDAAAHLRKLTIEQAQSVQKVVTADIRACVLTAKPVSQ